MAATVEQVRGWIIESGVLSEEAVRGSLDTLHPEARPLDGPQLLQFLVRQRKLTAFQAAALGKGKGKGLVLGNYVLLDKLGQGGMGAVFKAEHRRMKRVVALKVVAPNLLRTPAALRRFQREVEAAARLDHPHIVAAYDADEARGVHYLVLEYVPGSDLAALVRARGPLPVDQAIAFVAQAARGLAFAHARGVIHRDIKPSNLLLGADGTIKVLDLGLARIATADNPDDSASDLTGSGQIMGTVDYMAPEQAVDTRHADARSDIYSLGCTLWFLLTGKPAYDGGSAVQKIFAHRDQPVPSLRAARADVPEALDAVFRQMVAKRPEERFASMDEVAAVLEHIATGDSTPGRPGSWGALSDESLGRFLRAIGDTSTAAAATATYTPLPGEPKATAKVLAPDPAPAPPQPAPRGPAFWRRPPLVAAATALLIGMLAIIPGIILRVDTPAGTIVLEVDQPEAAGATVSVDDKQVITIRPGPAQEPITVAADARQHLLRVTKGGFETFTKAFHVTAGRSTSIQVRLEPLAQAPAPPTPPGTAGDHALFFRRGDFVSIPGLRFDEGPITVEFTIQPSDSRGATSFACFGRMKIVFWSGPDGGHGVSLGNAEWNLIANDPTGPLPAGKSLRLAAVYDGKQLLYFLDGKRHALGHPMGKEGLLPPGTYLGSLSARDAVFAGRLDEIRVSKTARYRTDYAPVPRLAADADTLALYHCDAGAGDVLADESGHGRDGKLAGPVWVRADSPDPPPPPSKPTSPPSAAVSSDFQADRTAARRVLDRGGSVGILVNPRAVDPRQPEAGQEFPCGVTVSFRLPLAGDYRVLTASQALPEAPFRLVKVAANNAKSFQDADLAVLRGLDALVQFEASQTQITDVGLDVVTTWPALRALYLHGDGIHDQGLKVLGRLKDLRVLILGGPTITDQGIKLIGSQPNLENLILGQTGMTDAGLAALGTMPRLTHLIIDNAALTDAGLAVVSKYPTLDTLGLIGIPLNGRGLAALKGLERLNWLMLTRSAVTDEGLAAIESLPFHSLILAGTSISDAALTHLHDRTLHGLDLSGTKVTAAGLAKLKNLRVTGYIDLSSTPVDDAAVAWLSTQNELTNLTLRGSRLTRAAVDRLRPALPACTITTDQATFPPIKPAR